MEAGTPGFEVWEHHRLLIRGAPGSGKTTLLKHMALVCARQLYTPARQDDRKPRNNDMRVRALYGWPATPFPIYIPLRALSDAATKGTVPLLQSYVATLKQVSPFGADLPECAPDFFLKRAQQGGCLMLLDAFDELRDAAARKRLGKLIQALPPGPAHNRNRIVVTCRIVGYEGQLSDAGFVQRGVDDLDERQAQRFIQARYAAVAAAELGALGGLPLRWRHDQRAANLIQRLPTHPGLRLLSRNPLLLSLAVAVHHAQRGKGHELPQERYQLYEEALTLLVADWERLKDEEVGLEPTSDASDLNLKERLRLLYELAWAMFEQSAEAQDSRAHAVIIGSKARAVLAATLNAIPGFAPRTTGEARDLHCASEAARWLLNLGQRGGVLQELGNVPGSNDVEIQFAHLTFQEYLAGCAIASKRQELRQKPLLRCWGDPRWREVLLLYAARADASPVIRHLLTQNTLADHMLAGGVLVERPLKLEQALKEQTVQVLRTLALADPEMDAPQALEVWQLLQDSGTLPEQRDLFRGACGPAGDDPCKGDRSDHRRAAAQCCGAGCACSPGCRATGATAPVSDEVQRVLLQVVEQEQDYRPRVAAGTRGAAAPRARLSPRASRSWSMYLGGRF